MDKQLVDLARELIELGFFTLIMLGLCTAVFCFVRVWTTQELIKAIGRINAKEADEAPAQANEGRRSELRLIPHLSSLSYSSVR